MRQVAFLSVVLSFVVLPSVAFPQQVGDKIVVTADKASLRANDAETGTVPKGNILVVKNVNGDRFWVIYSGDNGTVKGWINRSDVIPFSQALDFFNEELKRNPTAWAYNTRGMIWYEKGEYDIAIGDYNEAIRLNPRHKWAYNNRGIAWEHKKEYDKAISDYDEAIRLDPKLSAPYNGRGDAWRSKGEYDKAISDYDEAIRLDPKDALAYNNRGTAWYLKKDYDKAISDYDEAIRLDPQYAAPWNNRGNAWQDKKEYDKAISDYDGAIRLDPKFADAYNNRGIACSAKEEYDKAISDYNEVVRLDPKRSATYNLRGLAWEHKKEYDIAISDYDEAIRLDPKYVNPWNGRAWLEATCPDAKYRDGKKAVDDATKACELTGWKHANHLDTLAAAYAESGDFDAAVKWQTKARDMASEKQKADFQSRLDLYKAHKPCREEPKK